MATNRGNHYDYDIENNNGVLSSSIRAYNSFCRHNICENIKLGLVSAAVFLLCLVLFTGVALGYSVLELHPVGNYILLFICLILLAYVEALHYSVVAIEKWDMSLYAEKFPRAVKCHKLVDTPEKVKKFLVGRQFFVLFVVFLLAEITTFPDIPEDFAGLPPIIVLIFLKTGLPGVFLTLTFGQLISQIYVEEFTMQLMNLPGCEFCIRVSLAAEYIGVCNFSWLLYFITSRLLCHRVRKIQKSLDSMKSSGKHYNDPHASSEELDPMSPTELNRGPDFDNGIPDKQLSVFDYFKYIWSTGVTLGSVCIILYGIYIEGYILPTPVPAAYILMIFLLGVLFYLEGLMIAIVGTQYWDPETFREVYPRAYKLHKLVNQPDNVKRFIIGRQFFTVLTNFMLAQIFVFKNWKNNGLHPVIFFIGMKSGLVGIFVILAFAQLCPELLAAEFPLRFMNLHGSYSVVSISLFFDSIGVGHCAWSVYYITRSLLCGKHMEDGRASADSKPTLVKVTSAEVLAMSPKNSPTIALPSASNGNRIPAHSPARH